MRALLVILIAFIGFTSSLSGLIMIYNPDGIVLNLSLSLLDETPFKDFRVPGILLAATVGCINLIAVYLTLRDNTNRYNWAIAGGIMVCGWITVQMILISSAHWLHILYLCIGIIIILIALQLKGKWAV